jgi:hypothetical protein
MQFSGEAIMSKLDRVLVPGSTEVPNCRCGTEMLLIAVVPVEGGESEVRIFRCRPCSHELRLTIWRSDVSAA